MFFVCHFYFFLLYDFYLFIFVVVLCFILFTILYHCLLRAEKSNRNSGTGGAGEEMKPLNRDRKILFSLFSMLLIFNINFMLFF